jgi:hypothetical protein
MRVLSGTDTLLREKPLSQVRRAQHVDVECDTRRRFAHVADRQLAQRGVKLSFHGLRLRF